MDPCPICLDDISYNGIIAIKSTVEPGTTNKMINLYPNRKFTFVEKCSPCFSN